MHAPRTTTLRTFAKRERLCGARARINEHGAEYTTFSQFPRWGPSRCRMMRELCVRVLIDRCEPVTGHAQAQSRTRLSKGGAHTRHQRCQSVDDMRAHDTTFMLRELMAFAPSPARKQADGRGTSLRPCLQPTRLVPE
jgi:hypothetical protein